MAVKGSKWKHRILEETDALAHCANCGWVRKTIKDGRTKCSVARREGQGRPPARERPPGWGQRYRGQQLHAERRGEQCDVCGSTERLCTDHDHACCPGKFGCEDCIRGTLCTSCNHAEGWIRKLAQNGSLEAMLEYMGV